MRADKARYSAFLQYHAPRLHETIDWSSATAANAWDFLAEACEPRWAVGNEGHLESLHLFCLANLLRRPILLLPNFNFDAFFFSPNVISCRGLGTSSGSPGPVPPAFCFDASVLHQVL